MQPQLDLRLTVDLSDGPVSIPASASAPIDIPSGVSPLWAARTLLLNQVVVEYALASPLGEVSTSKGAFVSLWSAADGVRTELAFREATVSGTSVSCACANGATCSREGGLIVVRSINPAGPGALVPQVLLTFDDGAASVAVSVLVLDADAGARVWMQSFNGAMTAFLSDLTTSFITVRQASPRTFTLSSTGLGAPASVWLCPSPTSLTPSGGASVPARSDGVFGRFDVLLPPRSVSVSTNLVTPASPPRVIPVGARGRAEAPARDGSFGEWADAGVWNISLSGTQEAGVDARLVINYLGDSARVYKGSAHERADIVLDHFWNGHALDVPLSRFAVPIPGSLELRILAQGPRGVGAPVYFEVNPTLGAALISAVIVQTTSIDIAAA